MDFTPSSESNINPSTGQYLVPSKQKPVDEYGLPYQACFNRQSSNDTSYLMNPFNFLYSPEMFDKQLNMAGELKQNVATKNLAISRANQQYFNYFPGSMYGMDSMNTTMPPSSNFPVMHPINFPVFTNGNPYAISPAIVSNSTNINNNSNDAVQFQRTPTMLQLPIPQIPTGSSKIQFNHASGDDEEDAAMKKRKVSTCSSVSCSSPITSKDKRQNRKDFIDGLQQELLDTLEQDENLVRKAKRLETEIAHLKAKLKSQGLDEQATNNRTKPSASDHDGVRA